MPMVVATVATRCQHHRQVQNVNIKAGDFTIGTVWVGVTLSSPRGDIMCMEGGTASEGIELEWRK